MCIVLAVSKGGFNAIVGTAISASLLPPLVNCGLCLGLGMVHWLEDGNKHDARRFITVGWVCTQAMRDINYFLIAIFLGDSLCW